MNYDAKFNLTKKIITVSVNQVHIVKKCAFIARINHQHASGDSHGVSCHYGIEHLGMLKESQCQQ